MRGEVIALDLETTGLDVKTADIIEIGAAKCRGDEILERYQTLIKPGHAIPEIVTFITGIKEEDVAESPSIESVLPELAAFIGDRPIVGHRIEFDVQMLNRYEVARPNPRVDTFELAGFLLPNLGRYNLSSLSQELGIELTNAHRALDDAIASWQLYRQLWARLLALPLPLLAELDQQSRGRAWDAEAAISDALIEALAGAEAPGDRLDFPQLTAPLIPPPTPLTVHPNPQASDLGALAEKLPGLEGYPGASGNWPAQVLGLAGAAFQRDKHLLLETPPGPAGLWATALAAADYALTHQEPVVLAIATPQSYELVSKTLLPALQKQWEGRLHFSEALDRGQYLCPQRLAGLRERGPASVAEAAVLAKILVALQQGATGNKRELNFRNNQEQGVWATLSAEQDRCEASHCEEEIKQACPLHKAYQQAQAAHIILSRQSLLMHEGTGSSLLPQHQYLLIAEAHLLENQLTDGGRYTLERGRVLAKFASFADLEKGRLHDLLGPLSEILTPGHYAKLATFAEAIAETSLAMLPLLRKWFSELEACLSHGEGGQGDAPLRKLRVTAPVRGGAPWQNAARYWGKLREYTEDLQAAFLKIAGALGQLRQRYEDLEDLYPQLNKVAGAIAQDLQDFRDRADQFMQAKQKHTIYWIETNQEGDELRLLSAPLQIGDWIEEKLWEGKSGVVMASPYLRIQGDFQFMGDRLNAARGVDQRAVEVPENDRPNVMIYLPTDMPEPNQRTEYQAALQAGLVDLAGFHWGKILSLFTSNQQAKEITMQLSEPLSQAGVDLIESGSGGTRPQMLERFQAAERALLLGTEFYWEGVDIPGVSLLTLARLPFEALSDPVGEARSDQYGQDSFKEYTLNLAVLRFRQNYDRLNPGPGRPGVLVMFDRRMTSKPYGKAFLDSLPDGVVERGPLAKMKFVVRDWFAKA
jgi:DNA polymerase III epsilon subunit family exonuclease